MDSERLDASLPHDEPNGSAISKAWPRSYDDKAKAEALHHLPALGAVSVGSDGENVAPSPEPQMPHTRGLFVGAQ